MTFEVNGVNGRYDDKIKDDSVKYGRNAIDNALSYMEAPIANNKNNPAPILDLLPNADEVERNIEKIKTFADKNDEYLKSLPPLEFEYRYMPNIGTGKVDRKAVLGAAYEEMGVKELPVKEFEYRFLVNDELTAEPLDVNKDGKVDIAEYGANILATDLLSKGTTDVSKVDGTINNRGLNAILEYTRKANAEAAAKLYSNIYNKYELGKDLNNFDPQ